MLSINTNPSTPWPVTTGQTVQPIQPVTAPSAKQGSSNGSRQQADDGKGTALPSASVKVSTTAREKSAEPQAAPLLPRERPPEDQDRAQNEVDDAKAEEAERQRETERQRPQPQQLLSTIWKASAAVVDQALGEPQAATSSVEETQAAAESSGVVVVATAGRMVTGQQDNAEAPTGATQAADAQEVVAYDERGNGETAPVELGAIISERV